MCKSSKMTPVSRDFLGRKIVLPRPPLRAQAQRHERYGNKNGKTAQPVATPRIRDDQTWGGYAATPFAFFKAEEETRQESKDLRCFAPAGVAARAEAGSLHPTPGGHWTLPPKGCLTIRDPGWRRLPSPGPGSDAPWRGPHTHTHTPMTLMEPSAS